MGVRSEICLYYQTLARLDSDKAFIINDIPALIFSSDFFTDSKGHSGFVPREAYFTQFIPFSDIHRLTLHSGSFL